MGAEMTYDVILRERDNPEKKLKYPLEDLQSVCFYRISRDFEEIEDEWLDEAICPVLDSLVYYFNEDLLKADEVKSIMSILFDNCEYGVLWEVTPCDVINDCDHQIFLTGFGSMPRGLFMNKMFCIRNLIRDKPSLLAYQALMKGGVPQNIAAYLGGALEVIYCWDGLVKTQLKDYAGYIGYKGGPLASIVRGMATNNYCEQESLPWNDGWGYNYLKEQTEPDGSYKALPTEICDAVSKYQGDDLPESMSWSDLNSATDAQMTTLIRFICNNDEVSYSTQKES